MAKSTAKSNNTQTWVIAAVAVIVVILLIVWAKRGGVPAKEAPEVAAPEAPAPAPEAAPAPTAPPTEAAPAEEGEKALERKLGAPGNAEIVETTITWKEAGGQPVTKEVGATMFSEISCQHAERPEGNADTTTVKEDTLSFTLTNKGKKAYHLYYVKYGSEGYEDAMRVSVNGRRVRDVEKACGQMDIAAGETVACSGTAALLRTGEWYTGKKLVNILQAQSNDFIDNVVFRC